MSDTPNVQLSQIGQIAVNVHDLDKAVAFYRDVLGMCFLFEVPPNMAFFDCDGIRLMLTLPLRDEFDHPSSIIYYRVDDIKQTHADLSARDVRFLGKPHKIADMGAHELWMAFFYDPDDNMLALMSEVPVSK